MDKTKVAKNREWPRLAAVLGAGTMGLGIAESFVASGIEVCLLDATPELTQQAHGRLVRRVRGHVEAGLLNEEAVGLAEIIKLGYRIPQAVSGVDLVVEAVPEQLNLKRQILETSSAAAGHDAVIVSNTSSLPISQLARFVDNPKRFLGTHWFNPPEWTPGVEVIPTAVTDPGVVERVMELLRGIGKRPVVVGDGPGFVANRIQNALFLEALRCVEEGLASPDEVDEVVKSCFGFRLPFFGPFQIADMAGLDVYMSVLKILEEGLGERFKTPNQLRQLVERGRTGTKSGAGFLEYSDEERERLLLERDRRYAALNELLERLPPVEAGREGGRPDQI